MLINMVLPGAVEVKEPFAFEYSGNYTDNRDADGKGTVRLNTSGTLTVLSGKATVSVYILGAGGGGVYTESFIGGASGGGGGYQTVEVELAPGTYEIVIGTGGATSVIYSTYVVTAPSGGDTIAFGYTSTGGKGGAVSYDTYTAGNGGSPNGGKGKTGSYDGNRNVAGGSPNGGGFTTGTSTSDRDPTNVTNGGDGYVELTFS